MTVKELMERAGIGQTGKAIAYIKDGLEELEMLSSENVHSGERAYLKNNTFHAYNDTSVSILNATNWTGASGDTPPTNWTAFNTAASETADFSINYSGLTPALEIEADETITSQERAGVYQSITTIIGVNYSLTINVGNTSGLLAPTTAAILNAAPVNDEGFVAFNSKTVASDTNVSGGASIEDDIVIKFTATGTTSYLVLALGPATALTTQSALFKNPSISMFPTIYDSESQFLNAGFGYGQKLRISGSGSNNTADNNVSQVGYYDITGVTANTLSFGNHRVFEETSGETWELIGTKPNYIDLIAGKRYYRLPDDFIKMKDVKIKNHRNNTDLYRSIPRMIHEPVSRDKDDI